jgi:hypothetical protein
VTSRKRKDRGFVNPWGRARKSEARAIPVYNHVFRGWNHSNKQWIEPIWPELDYNLAGTKVEPKWLLSWKCELHEENPETAMVLTDTRRDDGESIALNEEESRKRNKGKAKEVVMHEGFSTS